MFSGPGNYNKNYLHILCGSYFSILRTSLCVKLRINLNKQAHHQHEMWFNFPIVFIFLSGPILHNHNKAGDRKYKGKYKGKGKTNLL